MQICIYIYVCTCLSMYIIYERTYNCTNSCQHFFIKVQLINELHSNARMYEHNYVCAYTHVYTYIYAS